MVPVSGFSLKFNIRKPDKSPNSGGIIPLRLFPDNSTLVTVPAPQVMPSQEQGVLVFSQPVLSVQLAPSVLLYSDANASHSACDISVTCSQENPGGSSTDIVTAWYWCSKENSGSSKLDSGRAWKTQMSENSFNLSCCQWKVLWF